MTTTSCLRLEKLSLKKVRYKGDELKTNGYYYTVRPNENSMDLIFLYRDGTINGQGGYVGSESSLDSIEKYYLESEEFAEKEMKRPWGLGLYSIKDKSIIYEIWIPMGGPGSKTVAVKYYGDIANDSTFMIKRLFAKAQNENRELNEIYHFRQFSPKPDSTNSFIK